VLRRHEAHLEKTTNDAVDDRLGEAIAIRCVRTVMVPRFVARECDDLGAS
jgi:hypothetical protein